jgi:hypothetical protein
VIDEPLEQPQECRIMEEMVLFQSDDGSMKFVHEFLKDPTNGGDLEPEIDEFSYTIELTLLPNTGSMTEDENSNSQTHSQYFQGNNDGIQMSREI